jgi:hypothetical protein
MRAGTGGEDDGVQAGERGGERSQRAADALEEELEGYSRARLVAAHESVQMIGQSGPTQQFRSLPEKRPHLGRAHPQLRHEMTDDARVEASGARAGQAVQIAGGLRHRDFASVIERAQAGGVTDVHDDGFFRMPRARRSPAGRR